MWRTHDLGGPPGRLSHPSRPDPRQTATTRGVLPRPAPEVYHGLSEVLVSRKMGEDRLWPADVPGGDPAIGLVEEARPRCTRRDMPRQVEDRFLGERARGGDVLAALAS